MWLIQFRSIIHLLKKSNSKYSPKIGRGRGTKLGKRSENCWKINFSVFSTKFWDLRKAIISPKYVPDNILMCQGQFGKNALLKPWKCRIFQFCSYFSIRLSLKSGPSTPTKKTFLKWNTQGLSSRLTFEIVVMTGIWKWVVFWSNYAKWFAKTLEQYTVTIATKQKIFSPFYIFWEFKEYA